MTTHAEFSPHDFAARRAELANTVEALHRQRGAAKIDGTEDRATAHLAAIDRELAQIADAEAEAVRRERQAAAERDAASYRQLAAELRDKEAARIAAVGAAETAAKQLVAALNDVLKIAEAERDVMRRMGDRAPQNDIGEFALVNRLSARLGEVFADIGNKPAKARRFGTVEWWFTGQQPKDWVETERRAMRQEG